MPGPVILNVDSNRVSRNALTRILSMWGFDVRETSSGKESLRVIQEQPPDLLLVHWRLRDVAGDELCRQLRAMSHPSPRLLRVPSAATKAITSKLTDCGADAYLQGPVNAAILASTVRSLLRLREAERDLERCRGDLVRARQEFHLCMSRTNHDLSEPLRAVTTFVEMIQREPEDRLTPDERTYLGFVLGGADRMRRLLHDVTSYSQLVRELSFKNSRVMFSAAVEGARNELREEIDRSGARIEAHNLPVVSGNLVRLQQLMTSLLDNAIKYRRNGGPPSICVRAERRSPAEWQISVADDGIGIAEQYHETIFAPFQRLHGREVSGSGMGLALSRRIVEIHNGKLWVESKLGEGATFVFTLPAVEDEIES